MKSVHTRSFSGPYFPTFGLNTDQKNLERGHFLRSVSFSFFVLFVIRFDQSLLVKVFQRAEATGVILFKVLSVAAYWCYNPIK